MYGWNLHMPQPSPQGVAFIMMFWQMTHLDGMELKNIRLMSRMPAHICTYTHKIQMACEMGCKCI